MHSLKTSWSIIYHMASLNLIVNASLGFLYGPIAQLVLVGIEILGRVLRKSPDAFKVDTGTLLPALAVASIIGLSCGAFIGLLGGIFASVPLIVVFRGASHSFSDTPRPRKLINALSMSIIGLTTLVVSSLINLPSTLSYLGSDWVTLGWLLEVVIPALLFSGASWWASDRVFVSLSRNDGSE
jgi:chromate transport protein ChrA